MGQLQSLSIQKIKAPSNSPEGEKQNRLGNRLTNNFVSKIEDEQ